MTQDLMNQAEDIFFARHSDADAATMAEIERDLRVFLAKLNRCALRPGIKAAIAKVATR